MLFQRTRYSRLDKFPGFLIVKRRKRHPFAVADRRIKEQFAEFLGAFDLRIAINSDHQSAETRQLARKDSERLQGQGIRDVQIVEHQNQRLGAGLLDQLRRQVGARPGEPT